MWQPRNLLSPSSSPSHTQAHAHTHTHTHTHTDVDLIQYMVASGKVAPGWLMCSLPGSRTIRADKGTSRVIHGRFIISHPKVPVWALLHTQKKWSSTAPKNSTKHSLTALLQLTSAICRNEMVLRWTQLSTDKSYLTKDNTEQQVYGTIINTCILPINKQI